MTPISISYLRGRILRYLVLFQPQVIVVGRQMKLCYSQMNTVQHSDKRGPMMLVAITPLRPIRSASRPMGIAVKRTAIEHVRKPTRLPAILCVWVSYLRRHRKMPSHSLVVPTDTEYHRSCKARDCTRHHLVNKAHKATVRKELSQARS